MDKAGFAETSILENRRALLESELERWMPLIIQHLMPERVILFGALNQARIQEWSDVDLVGNHTRHDQPIPGRKRFCFFNSLRERW